MVMTLGLTVIVAMDVLTVCLTLLLLTECVFLLCSFWGGETLGLAWNLRSGLEQLVGSLKLETADSLGQR